MPRRRSSASSPTPSSSLSRTDLLATESGDTDPGNGALSLALVYPNAYAVGMSSLGYQCVYQYARDTGCARVERAFALSCEGRTLETGRSIAEFDVAAFSVSYEMDYANVLAALDSARLPLFASRRDPRSPLVIAGGMAVDLNRHPVYPFVDILVHGGGRRRVEAVVAACARNPGFRRDAAARRQILADLASIPGVEATAGALRSVGLDPAAGHEIVDLEIEKRIEDVTLDEGLRLPVPPGCIGDAACGPVSPEAEAAVSRIATPHAELGRRVLVEIASGCPHACAFCWIGHRCERATPIPADKILEACEEACFIAECDAVGLIASAVGAHPEIDAICTALMDSDRTISFSSLRADEISATMIEALDHSGQKGITLAPETGDEELRRRLGKPIPDAAFLDAIERALRAGIEDVKLYFMTGLPGETEPEADRIVEFTNRVREAMRPFGRERGRMGDLSVNLGICVPKPGTPLARHEAPPLVVVRSRVGRIVRGLNALPNVRVSAASPDESRIQSGLSMGGLESAALLLDLKRAGPRWRNVAHGLARRGASSQ
ncbi:radical SAM protein [Candidatus Sumerlaeota bacterium]|nr:radical SAM protein [Candidatus Sumerlaeota bacterium]